eukprot:696978-Rhodomonas_salina.1
MDKKARMFDVRCLSPYERAARRAVLTQRMHVPSLEALCGTETFAVLRVGKELRTFSAHLGAVTDVK